MKGPSAMPGYPDGTTGFRSGRQHDGLIRLESCHIENRGSSGYRGTNGPGATEVINCLFRNNANSQLRLSASDRGSLPTRVVDSSLQVDARDLRHGQTEPPTQTDGMRLENAAELHEDGHMSQDHLIVENTDIAFDNVPQGSYAVRSPVYAAHGGFQFHNCRIRSNVDDWVVKLYPTTADYDFAEFFDCHFTGSSPGLDSDVDAMLTDCCVASHMKVGNPEEFGVENLQRGNCTPPFAEPNVPPDANFLFDTNGPNVTVDASISDDVDGDIVQYEWEANGQTATGEQATFSFEEAGSVEVTLTVTDDDGASATITKTVSPTGPGSNRRAVGVVGLLAGLGYLMS